MLKLANWSYLLLAIVLHIRGHISSDAFGFASPLSLSFHQEISYRINLRYKFRSNHLLLHRNPTDMVVKCGGKRKDTVFLVIESQYCNEPVPLGCDLNKYFSFPCSPYPPLDETGRLLGLELDIPTSASQVGSGKNASHWGRTVFQ